MSPKVVGLVEVDQALLVQLEHGEEAHDDLEPLDERAGERAERDAPDPGQLVDAARSTASVTLTPDRARRGRGRPAGTGFGRDRPEERGPQVVGGDAGEQVGREVEEPLLEPGGAGAASGRPRRPGRPSTGGGVLERLALEQAGQQQVALLPQRQLVVEVDVVVAGQQPPGLQLDQGGGDQQELGGDVEVERRRMLLELGQVGVDDGGERDLVEVDLLAQDQVQQQVERALEDRRSAPRTATADIELQRVWCHRPGTAGRRRRPGAYDRPPWPACSRASSPPATSTSATYLGALRHWVDDQHEHDALYCVVDLHALTVPQDPAELRATTLELRHAAPRRRARPRRLHPVRAEPRARARRAGLADGVHGVLSASCSRMTQFKDKSDRAASSCPAGLFTYPALMAADILLYDTDRVPVGDDQRQHLELARDVAEPLQPPLRRHVRRARGRHPQGRRPGHGPAGPDQRRCRSRTTRRQGTILLLDDPEAIEQEDQAGRHRHRRRGPLRPRRPSPACRTCCRSSAPPPGAHPRRLAAGYTQYGPLKADTADAVVELLRPIQERYAELAADPAGHRRPAGQGRGQGPGHRRRDARARASATVGLLPRA